MANLDTRDKRSSGLMPTLPFRYSGMLPLANGTVGQPDRQHVALCYSAIAAASPGGFQVAWARGSNVVLQPGVTG